MYIWASKREKLSSGCANNKCPDQPAHPRSLISAFVIPLLESITSKLATSENFTILASLCSGGGWFESDFFGNSEDRLSRDKAHIGLCGVTQAKMAAFYCFSISAV